MAQISPGELNHYTPSVHTCTLAVSLSSLFPCSEDTTANPLATLSSTEAPMNTQVPGSTMQTQMPAGSSEQPTLGNGGGTILLVEGLNASTVSNIVVISGAVVGAAAAVLIAAVLACGILFIIYQAHRRRKESEETPEVAEDGYELPRNRQDAVLSQSLNEYEVADPVLQNTLSPLTAVSTGGGGSQETSQLKPENSDLKLDLSLSQSFQQYEVMDAVLRNSQSSLLAVIERSEAEESVEETEKKELEEEEQEGKEEEVEEKKEEGRKGSDECGDADSQDRKSTSSNKTEEKTHRILPTPAEKSRPTMLKLISIDESSTNSDSTPKCVPISASPRKEPLSSQSSICSFTGFAQARFLESSDKVPTTDRDQVMPGNEVEENKDAVQEPLSPVFEEAPDNKKPPKPAPAPRKARPGPSTSTEDTLLEVTARAGATQEATPTGEYSSTTYPRSSKPKPKPRAAKRSESSVKGDEVDPEASTPSKDAAEKSGLV